MKYLEDRDLTLHQGDVREVLRSLPAESVHCVVTSPPYWGLRDYGTGAWEGGVEKVRCQVCDGSSPYSGAGCSSCVDGWVACDHPHPKSGDVERNLASSTLVGTGQSHAANGPRDTCGKCGARRIDNQLGLEPTPEQYVSNMVEVFREVRRVLRKDGTCWLNMGDSYATQRNDHEGGGFRAHREVGDGTAPKRGWHGGDLKPKDLCMIPARLALALQADGWYLRSQIVWSKPNPMPESVTDRPTTSHEFIYLLTRSPRYFFDQESVREPHQRLWDEGNGGNLARRGEWREEAGMPMSGGDSKAYPLPNPAGRNLRSVWNIATQPYPEAHFATYPEELVRRCILAGTSERGCCPECGGPWVREVEQVGERKTHGVNQVADDARGRHGATSIYRTAAVPVLQTTGWRPSCECEAPLDDHRSDKWRSTIPCTVLDPFFGSGTTGLVARKHGRRTIGIELSASYCALAARRLQQLSLLSEAGA